MTSERIEFPIVVRPQVFIQLQALNQKSVFEFVDSGFHTEIWVDAGKIVSVSSANDRGVIGCAMVRVDGLADTICARGTPEQLTERITEASARAIAMVEVAANAK